MRSRAPTREGPLARLLARLELVRVAYDEFEGDPGPGSGRLFGGLVLAQAAVAAGRTLEGRRLHALHAHFLRPGRYGVPIHFAVERVRDGGRFTTRHVVARQGRGAIATLSASFAASEGGLEHQDETWPEVASPEELPDWEEARVRVLGSSARRRPPDAIEVRMAEAEVVGPGAPRRYAWMRLRGAPPDAPLLRAALLVYASDRTLLGTAARAHGFAIGSRSAASLNHGVWLHGPPRLDDWLLYASESPMACEGRAWVVGRLLQRDGVRVASAVQEGLLRGPRARGAL